MKDQIVTSSTHLSQHSLTAQLKSRLILTVGVLVCCILLSSGISIFVAVNQQQLGDQKLSIHQNINDLLQAMIDQETGLRGYIATNNPTFLEPLTNGRAQYTTTLQQLKALTTGANFKATSNDLTQVDEQAINWTTTFAEAQITAMQAGHLDVARAAAINAYGKTLFDSLRHSIVVLQQAADDDLARTQEQENALNFGALLGSLLLTVIAIIWLWRTFIHFSSAQRDQMEILKETAQAFGAGDLSARVKYVTDADLSDLGNSFNMMASTLQDQQNALRDRDILEQVSQLNTTLTSSLDLTKVIRNFLISALTLLNIQIGVLYLYDPEKKQLQLFASRGLRAENIQPTFNLGEGLVGRVALERNTLMIAQDKLHVDQGFRVKTILGTVLPASLYHLPLLRGDDLLGVLVTGSLYPMREQARNVLNVIASNIAAVISNAQAYGHIQDQAKELAERSREQELSNTALRRQRDELTILNNALEEANRARSQFLSTMSHELRTPLTSVIGFSQMLLRTSARSSLTERQRSNIERILKNAEHLLSLINEVLDLAKIEAGRMDINTSEVNLKDLLSALVNETRPLAIERGIGLNVEVADDVPTIETDPTKLRQIVLNLISNALKFTEKGRVTITVTPSLLPDEKDRNTIDQVAIAIKDTGIGIKAEQQERIFEAFYQVDNSNSRAYGGTGLGLSIVRELITLLGGSIKLTSQPGEGTTFTVLLPMRVRNRLLLQDTQLSTIHGQSLTPYRSNPVVSSSKEENNAENNAFLVVAIDDNSDVLQLITASLEQSPYRVVGIQDSTQAVSIVQELQPHAITLDIMMPTVNGWQILHQLKSNPATASIPVILLTVLEDRSAGYILGADEFLVKPVARDALLATLHHLTNSFPHHAQPVIAKNTSDEILIQENKNGDASPIQTHLKHILLVNNAPHVQDIIERLVKEKGYILQTSDGDNNLLAMIEQTLPDLLMILVQMGEQVENFQVSEIINDHHTKKLEILDSSPNSPDSPDDAHEEHTYE